MINGTDFYQTIVLEALTDIEHGDGIAARKVGPESGADDGNLFLLQNELTGMCVFNSVLDDGVQSGVLLNVAMIPFVIPFNQENVSELVGAFCKKAEPCLLSVEKSDFSCEDEDGALVVRKLRNTIVPSTLIATELVVDIGHDSDKHQRFRLWFTIIRKCVVKVRKGRGLPFRTIARTVIRVVVIVIGMT